MLAQIVDSTRPNSELQIALDVIREYKSLESKREFMVLMFDTWKRLEELERLLEARLQGKQEEDEDVLHIRRIQAECIDPETIWEYADNGSLPVGIQVPERPALTD